WVINTLLTPERMQLVEAEIRQSMNENREEFTEKLRPVVQRGISELATIIETELPPILEKHREEIERLGARYQKEILQAELLPLVRDEVMPVVRKHAEPEVTAVGRELWQRLSLF